MIQQEGFNFIFDEKKCQDCGGKCCKGEGYVFLEVSECEKIAAFLQLSLDEFGMRYLRKVGNRYALIEPKDREECIFLDDNNKCTIYPVRPKNCRTFPFWDIFKINPQGACRECIGVIKK